MNCQGPGRPEPWELQVIRLGILSYSMSFVSKQVHVADMIVDCLFQGKNCFFLPPDVCLAANRDDRSDQIIFINNND